MQGQYYLPSIGFTRADFVADILSGSKKCLKCQDVKVRVVPNVEGLRTEDLIQFAVKHFEIHDYFAVGKRGLIIPPRTFI
mmetsp:Transcript_26214/g.30314  ORF Transcript_26214/g.30314 Transcript_26214/m.30314 type:complete len:80 (+) Transcript_26214:571-810(+)